VTHDEYREIRSSYARARELDPRLVAELRGVASRLVRYRGLPPSHAPYGVWNEEAEAEIFQSWATDRLIAEGQLQELLDRAPALESFRRLAERSLRQHVLNQRDRSQAQNLYWRMRDMLDEDDDFWSFVEASRPQDVWWGLSDWRTTPRPQFAGDDERLLAEVWALGEFAIIRYRPDAKKLSPLLATPELKRLLVSLFDAVNALLTLSRIIRALERRFDLGEIRLEALEEPEAQAVTAVEGDPAVLEESALALIAALTSRQADVLVATEGAVLEEDGETLDEIAARLGCSVGTVVNEQRRVAALLDRHSENDDQRGLVLRKVLDLLYGEAEEE
jgi:DNA-binding CsgD family transcriptional regulator